MSSQPRVANSRKAIILNLRLLNKLHPMPPKIAQIIFEENGLDKPTQKLFNNISYYLLFLIDPQFHSCLTCPLFDTKAEREYRSELSGFISSYAAKGHLTDLPASYLVHPSSYKVTVLMHQLSVLAMKQMVIQRIKGTEKQKLFDDVTEKFNKRNDNRCFHEHMKGFNYEQNILDKLSIFLEKKKRNERIAEMLRKKIIEGERKISTLKAQGYIDSLIDGFVEKNELDESFKSEVLKIKNINEPAPIFNMCLGELDKDVDSIIEKWDAKVLPLLETCRRMQQMSEELVKREVGQIEKSTYMLVYDPQRDFIDTEELQSQVTSIQKYVLRNIQQNGRLNFPNLIKAYVISMSYILKDHQFGDEIYDYNKRLKAYQKGLNDVKSGFIALLQRVDRAEKKLELATVVTNIQQKSIEDDLQIPPLVDLSGIKMSQNHDHINFDSFTPLNFSEHKFNLLRRGEVFTGPLPKSVLTAYHAPKDNFLKNKANETISECSSGFTKEQIWRMLSTKKKSSLIKPKKVHEHINKNEPDKVLKENLVSVVLDQESHPSKLLTASKIPRIIVQDFSKTEITGKLQETHLTKIVVEKELPNISISPITEHTNTITVRELQETHLSQMVTPRASISPINLQETHSTNVMPKPNTTLVKKKSSLEKIINRFKHVRTRVLPLEEENENLNLNERFINRNVMPDLLSPSFSVSNVKSNGSNVSEASVCSDNED